MFLVKGVNETVLYVKECDNTIQVQAIVTDINERSDSEGGTDISDEYNGTSYDDIYWKLAASEKEYSIN